MWSGRVSVWRGAGGDRAASNTNCRSGLIVRSSSNDKADGHPRPIVECGRLVTPDNISWPTRGPNVDATVGSSMRSRGGLKGKSTCKWGHSEEFFAGRRRARLGLSRRRSRVRVPSLPPLKVPANQQVALSARARRVASWPNPVAQTFATKCLQNGHSPAHLVSGRTKCTRSTRLARAKR